VNHHVSWETVYADLRRLAAAKLASQPAGQTLNATGLVHEAWLKLEKASFDAAGRTHFFRVAAAAMRQILVDAARAKGAVKRAGRRVSVPDVAGPMADDVVLAVDEVLAKLAAEKPEYAELVELRFFGGLTGEEAALALGVSPATADRMWRYARAWLAVELDGSS
jgi:RNA polymerase sigma factor (TIGR02999 family)